ncbi:MAG: hypothetical protein Q9226_004355 [Calogaya cf. arnoldii]
MSPSTPPPLNLEFKSITILPGELDPKEIYIIRSQTFQHEFWIPRPFKEWRLATHLLACKGQREDIRQRLHSDRNNLEQLHRLINAGSKTASNQNPLASDTDLSSKLEVQIMELAQLQMFFRMLDIWLINRDHPDRNPLASVAEQCIVTGGTVNRPMILGCDRE